MNYSEWYRTLSASRRYALATLFFLTAFTVRFLLFPNKLELPFIVFYPAVLITFLLCGAMPGVLSTLLSALVGLHIFTPLNYSFQSDVGVYAKLGTFLLLCALMGTIISRMQRYATELAFHNKEKEKRADELLIANKELNEIEHSLLIAKSEAEKANQAKSKFLAAASHDLRQPLTALSLYVDVLTKQNNGDDSELGKKIQDCVSSLSELLDNLLNVSKLDAGAVVATETTFRLSDTLRSLVNIHGAEAAHKGISLHVRCANLITHTDQTILQRILGNLIANAIRYTEKGGILIGCRHHNGKQWIEVWDSGVGFPSNMAQHIFEEFTQLGDNSRRVGSGLGLAIVGKSAKLLGLELRVHSRLGRGSMFAIEIPHGDAALIETSPESKTVVDKWNIALVDDNPMVLEATAFGLTAVGHQVIVGESELDLLKNIGYQEPDILISDYRLADNKTGLDLILNARATFGKDLPAILITGDTDPKLIKLFAKHKIKVCYKPLKIDVLNNFSAKSC